MKEILQRCIELDTAAQETYAQFAAACSDAGLRSTFERMGAEEWSHVEWWTELRDSCADGRVPALIDPASVLAAVDETAFQVGRLLETDLGALSANEMLEMAIRLEFFMLDPAFGELLDMLDPGSTDYHRAAYSRHVLRLVTEIENRDTDKGMASFLARVLTRSYRDQERLSLLATRDQLTALYNRRGFYTYLAQWCSWSERYGHALGVLVIDVDYFKTINDTLGHPAGDEALRAIANAISEAVRSSDLVARYGGDEFSVLAPETSATALEILAQHVLESVRAARFESGGVTMEMSVSVGAAYVPAGVQTTPEVLLSAADRSLYAAKQAGKDRAGDAINVAAESE